MSQAAAVASLNSMNLVATVQAVDSQLPGGTVVDQDPKAGIEVQPGATITVDISNAPAPTTVKVPAVAAIGLTAAQAKAKLALYGLKAKVIDTETPDFKPGLCIYQDPAAGAGGQDRQRGDHPNRGGPDDHDHHRAADHHHDGAPEYHHHRHHAAFDLARAGYARRTAPGC